MSKLLIPLVMTLLLTLDTSAQEQVKVTVLANSIDLGLAGGNLNLFKIARFDVETASS